MWTINYNIDRNISQRLTKMQIIGCLWHVISFRPSVFIPWTFSKTYKVKYDLFLPYGEENGQIRADTHEENKDKIVRQIQSAKNTQGKRKKDFLFPKKKKKKKSEKQQNHWMYVQHWTRAQ